MNPAPLLILAVGAALLVAKKASAGQNASTGSEAPFLADELDTWQPSWADWLGIPFLASETTEEQTVSNNANMPRGIRNNNPLNIEAGQGFNGENGTDGRFATFATPWYGIRAAARIMKTYKSSYGLVSIADIVNRWAPPTENDTAAYIANVANWSGVASFMPLTDDQYPAVIAGMIRMENGQQPYDMLTIADATQAGLA